MTNQILRIEHRALGIYPYLFYAGAYLWPISPEAVDTLKRHVDDAPERFVTLLRETVATTKYLRHQLDMALAGAIDRDTELRAFQHTLRTL